MVAHDLRSAGGAAIACCNSVYDDLRNRSMNSPLSTTGSGLGTASVRAAGACAGAGRGADVTTTIARPAATSRLPVMITLLETPAVRAENNRARGSRSRSACRLRQSDGGLHHPSGHVESLFTGVAHELQGL